MRVILDTDIGPDCDDAGVMAVLHALARCNEVRILGVMHCTSNEYGAGCIDAINRFYGQPDIPIGTLKKEGFLAGEEYQRYNRYIAENFENAFLGKSAPDAVELYRQILSEQPDGSVDIVAIGPLTNLAGLLESKADKHSSCNGVELVSKKVRRLITMAGRFTPDETGILPVEWNVLLDVSSAQRLIHDWHTPIVFCGYEIGESVITGKKLMKLCNDSNPVKKAYDLYTSGSGRSSWDPITVLYAIRGGCGFWELSPEGIVNIDDAGVTHFSESETGRHRYMRKIASVSEEDIEQYLEDLMMI